jgi:hypothetical protein
MVPGAVRTSVTLVVQYIGNTVVVSGYVFVVLFLVFSGGCPPKKKFANTSECPSASANWLYNWLPERF